MTEQDAVDWRLAGLDCTSRDGTSQVATSTGDAEARIDLGAGDLVTCTYTDEYAPPPQGLLIRKVTEGGVGTFDFTVEPVGTRSAEHATATTEREGVAVDAVPSLELGAGRYRIVEDLPADDAGRWALERVECGGEKVPVSGDGVEVTVSAREVETCTFTNNFTPHGSIEISKVTRGGVGTTGFEVDSAADPEVTFAGQATTTAEDAPARAEGEAADHLELGTYTITESPPAPGAGEWELVDVTCDGRVLPFAQGRIEVTLTAKDPHRHCTFVNRFRPKAEPPLPTPQRPDEAASADLEVTKRLVTAIPEAGETIEYELTVTNRGRGDAGEATIVDQPLGPARLVFARPDRGSCGESLPVSCNLGTLDAGQTTTVRVGIISPHPGLLLNRAVAGTDSNDQEIAGAHAESPAKVRPARVTRSPVPGLG